MSPFDQQMHGVALALDDGVGFLLAIAVGVFFGLLSFKTDFGFIYMGIITAIACGWAIYHQSNGSVGGVVVLAGSFLVVRGAGRVLGGRKEERAHQRSVEIMRLQHELGSQCQTSTQSHQEYLIRMQTEAQKEIAKDRTKADVQIADSTNQAAVTVAAINAAASIQVAKANAHIGSAEYMNDQAMKMIEGVVAQNKMINEIAEEDPLIGKQVMVKWHKHNPERASDI